MTRRLLALLALLAPGPLAAQGFLFDGVVAEVGPQTVVQLDAPQTVARGTLVYTFEPVDVNGLQAGRLTGTFRVLHADSLRLVVVPLDPAAPPGGAQAGQRAQVDLSAPPGLVEVTSDPPAARVTWRDEVLGATPLELKLADGPYTFWLDAPGHEQTPVSFDAEADRIIAVAAPMIAASPALSVLRDAQRLYRRGLFSEARAQLDRLTGSGDASALPPLVRQEIPLLRRNMIEAEDLVAQAAAAGLTDALAREALEAYLLFRDNEHGGNERAIQETIATLRRLLPDAPLVGRLTEAHPPPSPEAIRNRR